MASELQFGAPAYITAKFATTVEQVLDPPAAGITPCRPEARPLPDWTKARGEPARADHQLALEWRSRFKKVHCLFISEVYARWGAMLPRLSHAQVGNLTEQR